MPIKIKRTGSLEIDANSLRLGSAFFKFQMVGIIFMGTFIVATLLGVFGNGVLSETYEATPSLAVAYNHYARHQAINVIHIDIMPNKQNPNAEIKLAISQSYFKNISLKSITPSPSSETFSTDSIIYSFPASDNAAVAHITIAVEPEDFGVIHGHFALLGSSQDKIEINQVIYP